MPTFDPNKPVRNVDGKEYEKDLVNVPERKSSWFNEYVAYSGIGYGPYDAREEADAASASSRTAVVELIFEDGKLVDFKRWATKDE